MRRETEERRRRRRRGGKGVGQEEGKEPVYPNVEEKSQHRIKFYPHTGL